MEHMKSPDRSSDMIWNLVHIEIHMPVRKFDAGVGDFQRESSLATRFLQMNTANAECMAPTTVPVIYTCTFKNFGKLLL